MTTSILVFTQEKDVVYTLTQLAPVAFHKEHHHGHGTIQRHTAAEVSSRCVACLANNIGKLDHQQRTDASGQ